MSAAVSDRVLIGPGPECKLCGRISDRYRHGEDWRPPAGKGYYREWNICANTDCTTTTFADEDDYVPAPGAPVRVANDPTLQEFISAISRFGSVSEGKLRLIFNKSNTFKSHWLEPNPKSMGSMMFTCFHFGLTHEEALLVLVAWHDKHGTACADDLEDLDAVVEEKYGQARAQAAGKDQGTKTKARLDPAAMAALDEYVDIEKVEFDSKRGKYVVIGVLR